jgi:hypothetical protein
MNMANNQQQEHFEAIKGEIEDAIFNHASTLDKIKNYKIHSIDRVWVTGFKGEEPNLKHLFSGKGSKAWVEGTIRFFKWNNENSRSKVDMDFWAQDVELDFDADEDKFIVKSFKFIPLS